MSSSGPFVASDFTVADFAEICDLLRGVVGGDLAHYKVACVKRRIAARLRELGYNEPRPYIEFLRRSEMERRALVEALAIHVSRFYRDSTTFATLRERFLPGMIAQAVAAGKDLHWWCAGCAGGEEAYSLALLAADLAPELSPDRIAISGSDISEEVLERARAGRFDEWHLSDVPPGELARYFAPAGRGYELAPQLRARVRFERCDLLARSDYPPAEMILCRYVLIYFAREEQEEVVRRFAAALPPGGLLVLGRTEVLRDPEGFFEAADAPERIYRRL